MKKIIELSNLILPDTKPIYKEYLREKLSLEISSELKKKSKIWK